MYSMTSPRRDCTDFLCRCISVLPSNSAMVQYFRIKFEVNTFDRAFFIAAPAERQAAENGRVKQTGFKKKR